MKRSIFISLAITVVFVTLLHSSAAQVSKKDEGALQDKYRVIQVETFDTKIGVDFPPNYWRACRRRLYDD